MFMETEARCEAICLQIQDFERSQLKESITKNVLEEVAKDEDMVDEYIMDEDVVVAERNDGDSLVNDLDGNTLVNISSDQTQWRNGQADVLTNDGDMMRKDPADEVTEDGDMRRNDEADELKKDGDMMQEYVKEEDSTDAKRLGDTCVNEPNDQAQRTNEHNQSQCDSNEPLQHYSEVKEEVAGTDTSSLVTFNIKHQATVNLLNEMDSESIAQKLASSLESMRSSGYDVPDFIRFTKVQLLEDGNIEAQAHAGSNQDIERLSRLQGRDLKFEKSIIGSTESYAVETTGNTGIRVDIFSMRTRKQKANTIKELLGENLRSVVSLRGVDDIRDVSWCKDWKAKSSLVVRFRTAQQADEVLDSGIFIRGKHSNCKSVDRKFRRCGRCQAFGHYAKSCSSAWRCGRCASLHSTSACASNVRQCSNCHGPHRANLATCPAREAYQQKLRYTYTSRPVEKRELGKPASQTQNPAAALNLPSPDSMLITSHIEERIKAEEEEGIRTGGCTAAPTFALMPDDARDEPHVKAEGGKPNQEIMLAQDPSPDLRSLQKQVDDLRLVVERHHIASYPHSQTRKRGVHEMLMDESSSHASKQPRYARHGRDNYPARDLNQPSADRNFLPYAPPPGRPIPRQIFIRTL